MTTIATTARTAAITDFIYEANPQYVVGYLSELPSPEVMAMLARLDYAASIILSEKASNDLAELRETDPELADIYDTDGIAVVGGYAIDTMPNSEFGAFKKSFNMFECSRSRSLIEFSNDFLIAARVSDTGILVTDMALRFDFELNNFGTSVVSRRPAGMSFSYFEHFKKALSAIQNFTSYRASI